MAAYRAAIRLEPGSFAARVNLGNLLRDRLHDHAGGRPSFAKRWP